MHILKFLAFTLLFGGSHSTFYIKTCQPDAKFNWKVENGRVSEVQTEKQTLELIRNILFGTELEPAKKDMVTKALLLFNSNDRQL